MGTESSALDVNVTGTMSTAAPASRVVTSKDGTSIAYSRTGVGELLLLVDGALGYRDFDPSPQVARLLAESFTVISYDRRGRGESGDTKPYQVEREIEDIRAIVDAEGGSAHLVGFSSGAVLALRAASAGVGVRKLALYEPPLVIAGATGVVPPDRGAEITAMVTRGERSEAVKAFLRMVGASSVSIAIMRLMPGVWSKLTGVAHTLPNDFAILGDTGAGKPLPEELKRVMASIKVPTWVGLGGKSPPYMRHATETVAKLTPGARHVVLEGQTHKVNANAIVPALRPFLQT